MAFDLRRFLANDEAESDEMQYTTASANISGEVASEAPVQIEMAPGVILVTAEVRDQASLKVIIGALQALSAVLPAEPPKPALPPSERNVAPPRDVTPAQTPLETAIANGTP